MIADATFNERRSWWTYAVILTVVVVLPCHPVRGKPPTAVAEEEATQPVSSAKNLLTAAKDKSASPPASKGSEDIEHWKRSTWRMAVKLDTSNLEPPAVQWAVLEEDPISGTKARVKRMRDFYRDQLERAEDETKKAITRSSQMTVSWDLGFKEITGDRLYLLTSGPYVSHGFSSNGPDGKKWIATKIVRIKGKPVCWCIPVKVKKGRRIQVTLTEDNMFDLESVFDDVMRESSQGH